MVTDLALALNGEGFFEMKIENELILIKEEVYNKEGKLTVSSLATSVRAIFFSGRWRTSSCDYRINP